MYRHIRLDKNEIFYIGIGTKPKKYINTHEGQYSRAFNKSERSIFWKRIIDKSDYEVEILIESDDYEFIKQKEIEFIKLYGRRDLGLGTLCNLTDGGDGNIGRIYSKETLEKLSKSHKGQIISKEQRDYLSLLYTGTSWTTEHRDNYLETIRSRKFNPGASILLCKETGIYYQSIKEASIIYGISRSHLSSMLRGIHRNFTSLILAESENDGVYPILPENKPYSPYIPTEEDRKRTSERVKGKYLGSNSPMAKKVIHTVTGVVYSCTKEVAQIFGYDYKYFCNMLNPNNSKNNNTPFEYYDEEKHKHLIKQ